MSCATDICTVECLVEFRMARATNISIGEFTEMRGTCYLTYESDRIAQCWLAELASGGGGERTNGSLSKRKPRRDRRDRRDRHHKVSPEEKKPRPAFLALLLLFASKEVHAVLFKAQLWRDYIQNLRHNRLGAIIVHASSKTDIHFNHHAPEHATAR